MNQSFKDPIQYPFPEMDRAKVKSGPDSLSGERHVIVR